MNPFKRIASTLKENIRLRWLLIVNCAVFILIRLSFPICGYLKLDEECVFSVLAFPSEWTILIRQPWSIITYMFLQASPFHLILNIIMIYWFGEILSQIRLHRILFKIYILSGIAGALFYFAAMQLIPFPPGSAGLRLAGASAATLGLAGYACAVAPGLRFALPLNQSIRLRPLVIIIFILSIISCIGVDYGAMTAHCGGFVGGLLLPVVAKKGSRKMKPHTPNPCEPTPEMLEQRLDSLLEKISLSGYASLSEKEKSDLTEISSLLKRKGL